MTRCVFVLDLFNGAVVHAVRGEREKYEPIERSSLVVGSSDPTQIIKELAPKEIYLADLDRIIGSGDNLNLICQMVQRVRTMADIGISKLDDLWLLPTECTPILGTETVSLELLRNASEARDITVSVDMFAGNVLTRDHDLKMPPIKLIEKLNDINFKNVILLELDRVGTSVGLNETFLQKAASLSRHDLILGGGIKKVSDLNRLEEMGIAGALVATAIHKRKIPLELIR